MIVFKIFIMIYLCLRTKLILLCGNQLIKMLAKLKKNIFILSIFLNIALTGERFNLRNLDNSYFYILISPDKSKMILSNTSYNTLTFLTNKEVFFSNIPTLNAFNCKWSPDSEKLLIMTSNYSKKKRLNGLYLLNKVGEVQNTIIDNSIDRIFPLGWTGKNTIHYLINDTLRTFNIDKSKNEWDNELIYAIDKKVFIKENDLSSLLIYEAKNSVLNLDYSKNGRLIVFEVYGHNTVVLNRSNEKIISIGKANGPVISPDDSKILFMDLSDDGYQFTSGDIFLWDLKSETIIPILNDPEIIEMNPVWLDNGSFYYIDYKTGSVKFKKL